MMLRISLVLILLVGLESIQMDQYRGLESPGYTYKPIHLKYYGRTLNYKLKDRNNSLQNHHTVNEIPNSLMSQGKNNISSDVSINGRKMTHQCNSENYIRKNDSAKLDCTTSIQNLNNSTSTPQGDDAFLQSSATLKFFWNATETKENIRKAQAQLMRKYMDLSADPCENFYKYACGNWNKYHPIPKDQGITGSINILIYTLHYVLRELLEKNSSKVTYSQNSLHISNSPKDQDAITAVKQPQLDVATNDAERKAKILYQSCANMTERNRRGKEPLLHFINSLGGWPVITKNWRSENFDWLNLTAHLRRYENGILMYQWVDPDFKTSDRNVIHFAQTTFGLPTRVYFLQEKYSKYLRAYERFMSDIMHKMGASKNRSAKTAKDMIRFETHLASIAPDLDNSVLTSSKANKRMTLQDLQALIPQIDWKRYLSVLQQRNIDDTEHIIMHASDYMRDLANLMNHTDPEIVANYLFWRFVKLHVYNLDESFYGIILTYLHELNGRKENPPLWKFCIFEVNESLGMVVGSIFVRKYFDGNNKMEILRMTNEVKHVFRENLKMTDWLDSKTKRLAKLKVDAMTLKIGYPDFILNSTELNTKYSDVKIYSDKYFENILNISLHKTRTMLNKLHEPVVDKTTWEKAPTTVNAFYYQQNNQMIIPAGILQPSYYHRHFPRALNFGGIGTIIGHEMTHGFDNTGRQFDRNGSINNWWTNTSMKGFEERAKCIVKQYGNYTLAQVGKAVNGEKTQSENIADNNGIKLAFQAYKKWLLDNPKAVDDEHLPGVNMTGEQLFFLSFGQQLCTSIRNETVSTTLYTDSHTPAKFRVIGPLCNMEDFSKAFNCPLVSPMNPKQKCSVW